jgi:hypothetical protein
MRLVRRARSVFDRLPSQAIFLVAQSLGLPEVNLGVPAIVWVTIMAGIAAEADAPVRIVCMDPQEASFAHGQESTDRPGGASAAARMRGGACAAPLVQPL